MKRLIVILSLFAAPVHAGQPIYVSMAECAGIFDALISQISPSPRRTRVEGAQENWAQAAHAEAGRDVSALISEKSAHWLAKGPSVVYTEEFDDWAKYCRSLAKHKKLVIVPKK
jgi:hypothetical protein